MTPAQIAEAQKLARDWQAALHTQQTAVAPEPQPRSPPTKQIGSGSGLLVSTNGEVLTNAHVVEGCRAAVVTVQDKAITAPITARDRRIDLALLKMPQRSSATAPLRLTVRQGESVFVYGFPLPGLLSSDVNFTAGTVTALAGLHDDTL
jgi:serine protease Do